MYTIHVYIFKYLVGVRRHDRKVYRAGGGPLIPNCGQICWDWQHLLENWQPSATMSAVSHDVRNLSVTWSYDGEMHAILVPYFLAS